MRPPASPNPTPPWGRTRGGERQGGGVQKPYEVRHITALDALHPIERQHFGAQVPRQLVLPGEQAHKVQQLALGVVGPLEAVQHAVAGGDDAPEEEGPKHHRDGGEYAFRLRKRGPAASGVGGM